MQLSQDIIKQVKDGLADAKILVVGDVMLDRYWFGEVARISPEAPVPIAKVTRTEDRPGGAANVARNIANIGAYVTLLSVVGDDEAGALLGDLLKKDNVNATLVKDESISTIIKLRVLARNQQLIRLDFEQIPSHEILNEVLDSYEEVVSKHDVIILSDYGKGGLSHTSIMIELAKKHNKIILVDPKGSDYERYTGATIITPNKNELRDAVGNWNSEDELLHKAQMLKEKLDLKYLLLTRSDEGMSLFLDSEVKQYPTVAREVYDVSGAGDTVIAVLGAMLAARILIKEAVQIANVAAGIVIGKLGTATITKEELIQHLNMQ